MTVFFFEGYCKGYYAQNALETYEALIQRTGRGSAGCFRIATLWIPGEPKESSKHPSHPLKWESKATLFP